MKASFEFRDDQKPLFRGKIPLNILGFPFQSGIAAGDSKELCLNLSTFFESGPSLKISYRPNDSWNPFSLVVKTGIGHFGSPIYSPMTMSAEFNLIGSGNPSFFLHFRPQIGDFSIKKSVGSAISLSSTSSSSMFMPKIQSHVKDSDSEDGGQVDGGGTPLANGVYQQVNSILSGKRINGLSPDNHAAGVIDSLLSGVKLSAETSLPVRNHAVVKFRWGVRFPVEQKSAFTDNIIRNPTAEISFRKIPFLELNKISIEHVAEGDSKGSRKRDPEATISRENPDFADTCFTIKRQLEILQAENGVLRKTIEEIRSEIVAGKLTPMTGIQDSGKYWDSGKTLAEKKDRRSESKLSEFGNGKVTNGDVNEELKKALMGATGAGI